MVVKFLFSHFLPIKLRKTQALKTTIFFKILEIYMQDDFLSSDGLSARSRTRGKVKNKIKIPPVRQS
jgi:hypothetical protein